MKLHPLTTADSPAKPSPGDARATHAPALPKRPPLRPLTPSPAMCPAFDETDLEIIAAAAADRRRS